MTFDEVTEQYLEELAETDASRETLLLESAIAHTRGVSGAGFAPSGLERRRVADPKVEFANEILRLTEWATVHGVPIRHVSDQRYGTQDAEGTEHWVWFEDAQVRRISFSSLDHFDQGPLGQTTEAFHDSDGSLTLRRLAARLISASAVSARIPRSPFES